MLKKWKWPLVGSGLSLAAVLVLVLAPAVSFRNRQSSQAGIAGNMRQIVLALVEFESRYGKFPGTDTVEAVREATSTDLDLGTRSSNDFFRQLLATGIVRNESVFYSGVEGTRRPDEVMDKGEAMKKGECGFVYLANLDGVGNPGRPLLLVGVIPGTDRFDRKIFSSKTVLARADGSVTWVHVNPEGHVIMSVKNILDPTNPVWGGKPPTIAWPE